MRWSARNPVQVGFLDTGRAARGVHEFWAVRRRDGRVIAILTVPFSDTRDAAGRGDIRIADVTDPTRPVEIVDWGLRDQFPADQVAAMQNGGQGCFPFRFGHGADSSPDGMVTYGRTGYLAHEDGDAHSSNVSLDSNPAEPERVSVFKTPNSLQASRNRKGDYTVHNPLALGSTVFLSWYTDGLRVVDTRGYVYLSDMNSGLWIVQER